MLKFFLLLFFPVILSVVGAGCRDAANQTAQIGNANAARSNANAAPSPIATPQPNAELPVSRFQIVRAFNHDDDAFTQGLIFHSGFLYESTGQYGESTLRKVELETGKVKEKIKLDDKYFAEGMTLLNGKIYQITWQEGVCFVYDAATLEKISLLAYNGEGWGLATDGKNLIMSD
ncbi:MAG: glutaminyl-peptide cyclotransferase, partial [Microcoleus sp. SIO2G3]|nr:glutaminyl-peptide cyclotransferase [Microcoleus sp. SIO2G3]